MIVTISVTDEAQGIVHSQRTCLHSDDYPNSQELEAAAVKFIRDSHATNQSLLASYLPKLARSAGAA